MNKIIPRQMTFHDPTFMKQAHVDSRTPFLDILMDLMREWQESVLRANSPLSGLFGGAKFVLTRRGGPFVVEDYTDAQDYYVTPDTIYDRRFRKLIVRMYVGTSESHLSCAAVFELSPTSEFLAELGHLSMCNVDMFGKAGFNIFSVCNWLDKQFYGLPYVPCALYGEGLPQAKMIPAVGLYEHDQVDEVENEITKEEDDDEYDY